MSQIGLFPEGALEGRIVGGKYRLDEKLSEGGGGIVWRATDPSDSPVALKFLKWSPLKSRKAAAERFKNEFAILKSLSHPNISRIYDFGLDPETDQYFFTTELFSEGDLKKLLEAPIPTIEELLLQSLRSLEYLNNHKLLHLDIKPQNLLLRQIGKRPILALIDFGLATFRSPDKPGGTPNYMPPELIVKRLGLDSYSFPLPDHRSDLYSLGVTFYYCLTGVQPFCKESKSGSRIDSMETLKQHLSYDPPPPSAYRSDVPPYLDRIIMKLMARHPDERYPSALIAAQALQYSSPREYPPETRQTLLSYLPKEGKIIGRKFETDTIKESFQSISDANSSVPHIICISGAKGTGRTRFLKRLKPIAQQMEMNVHLFNDENPPARAKLNSLLNLTSQKSDEVHVILIDDIDQILNKDDNEQGHSGEDFTDLVHALKPMIRKTYFQRKIQSASTNKILILFSVNSEKTNPKDVLSDLGISSSHCRMIELKNFETFEIEEYLTAVLGEKPDDSVVQQVMDCTEGNPLFLTEQIESMIAKGRLFSLAGRPDAKTLKAIGIDFSEMSPSKSLTTSLMRRLNELPPEACDLAFTVACWHRPATIEELQKTDHSGKAAHELLPLVESGILIKDAKGSFSFPNPLYSDAILENYGKVHIEKCHDEIANYLRNNKRKPDDELLSHLAYGSIRGQKKAPLLKLADLAFDDGKAVEGINHLKELIEVLPSNDWSDISEILILIGNAYKEIHNYGQAALFYKKLSTIKATDPIKLELKLKSLECIGRLEMRRRRLKQASKAFSEGLKLSSRKKALTTWKLIFENYLAGIELRNGNVEEAINKFERSESVATKLLKADEQSKITNNELGEALLRKGEVKKALKIIKKDIKFFEKINNLDRMANLYYLLSTTLCHNRIKKYDAARKEYHKGLDIAKEHHMLNLQVRILNGLGNLELKTGNPKDAIVHYDEGFRLSQQIDSYTTSVELMINMGLASQQLGNISDTIEYLEAALDFSSGPKGEAAGLIRRFISTIFVSLGDAYYQKREYDRALEYLEKAKALDEKERLTPDLRYSLYGTFADIMLDYHDYEEAKKLMPTLRTIAKAFPPAKSHLKQLNKKISKSVS
ncbi:MAG: protein kinase [Deltaproteobacteria bacterium]|jgi:eukaryotic-like serine/threonine-protein kinase|nr:protein kinase [Deltaproteobacteria bacterium]